MATGNLPPLGARPFVTFNLPNGSEVGGYLTLASLAFLNQLFQNQGGNSGVPDPVDTAVPDEATLAATVDAVARLEPSYPAAAAIAALQQRIADLEEVISAVASPLLGTMAPQNAERVTLGTILVRESFLSMGVTPLVSGVATVANTLVAANSRIFAFAQDASTIGTLGVSARVAGTSFTLTSTVLTDSGNVAWLLLTPGSPD